MKKGEIPFHLAGVDVAALDSALYAALGAALEVDGSMLYAIVRFAQQRRLTADVETWCAWQQSEYGTITPEMVRRCPAFPALVRYTGAYKAGLDAAARGET